MWDEVYGVTQMATMKLMDDNLGLWAYGMACSPWNENIRTGLQDEPPKFKVRVRVRAMTRVRIGVTSPVPPANQGQD